MSRRRTAGDREAEAEAPDGSSVAPLAPVTAAKSTATGLGESFVPRSPSLSADPPPQRQPMPGGVTAGMVDDNADFGERYLVEVTDATRPGDAPGTQASHDVKQYSVQTLDRLVVKLVADELAHLRQG